MMEAKRGKHRARWGGNFGNGADTILFAPTAGLARFAVLGLLAMLFLVMTGCSTVHRAWDAPHRIADRHPNRLYSTVIEGATWLGEQAGGKADLPLVPVRMAWEALGDPDPQDVRLLQPGRHTGGTVTGLTAAGIFWPFFGWWNLPG
jgi:hypothetical protein